MRRFFLPLDVHHIRDVVRLQIGDKFELADGQAKVFLAQIEKLGQSIEYKILSEIPAGEPKFKVTLAQALPKGQNMDFVIEKAVELGVNKIIPMLTLRTVAKNAKLARWQKLAKAAAEQSGRAALPAVEPLTKFETVLKMIKEFDLVLIAWEEEKMLSLKQALRTAGPRPLSSILVLIGPEGGFSEKEISAAKAAGFTSVSLGQRILRTETAGLAMLAAINYEFE